MTNWTDICNVNDILPNSGRAALHEGEQVAIFRITRSGNDAFFAVANYDPCSGANVMSRGIVGNLGDKTVVASPVYKQHFCLDSGQCLEEDASLKTWPVRVDGDRVMLAS
ncbi:nitrite reductase (NAD(P)H) small subunit [Halioglobus japonicus]|uniref:Nitrite reductase (NAD(P)H) small subunit n=1 Tax=Halioglobus japonicus TaxID=930805 RepID=A0AAP8SM64_9GAMM|nr:nitrite reductase small subunit NirD [Halioglobus japonicus]AQA17170.1 nitrite reductase (NAD(P)H) small subunit [Halioglobus japonicus]PLW85081.1 nitrite reductase (NAD(P)H) small subunit [Halioglobus japonicus]GHD19369.1 nitrite reductase small subunit [Halioglobus japonicus]